MQPALRGWGFSLLPLIFIVWTLDISLAGQSIMAFSSEFSMRNSVSAALTLPSVPMRLETPAILCLS
jgi:hypothetical protein